MTIETPGQASEATGVTEAQAAERFMELLTRDEGQSEDQEPLEEETSQAEGEDEAQAEDEPEEQSEEPEEDEGQQEQQQELYTVKIDGAEQTVTLGELTAGYQREQDYRRKTMALAEERKALEPERQAITSERAQLTERLKALEESLTHQALSPEELDWMRSNDPQQYAVVVADQLRQKQQLDTVTAERQRLEAQNEADAKKALIAAIQAEGEKLIAARPEWKDPEKSKAINATISAYAKDLGLTPEEFDGISDHRVIIALHDAAQWRQLQAKTPQTRAKVEQVKVARPGGIAPQHSKTSDVTRAKQRLAKTGRVEDAADVFLKRMG